MLVALSQLISSSCSKYLYPEYSFPAIESQAERNKLKVFMDAGVEKEISTNNLSTDEIIETARQYLGVPYCMGGTTTKCMDCSGMLHTVFASYGILLPHNSEEQARYGKILSTKVELKRGDLVFFIQSYKSHQLITHSGIYLGNDEFIHTSTKKGVSITSINDPWWSDKFIFGTRIFK